MNTPISSSSRAILCGSALFVLGCAFVLALAPTPALAADDAAMQPATAQAPSLPLSASFEKVAGAENAPFVLTLKNDSDKPIKANAKVLLAVAFHAESKARSVPEQVIEPGKTMTIAELALGDRVVVTAEGFATLDLTVK